MVTKILISVVICTWNGKNRIKETLISLNYQSLNRELYEVLVVDNGSTDGSSEWLNNKCKEFDFIFIFEPELGLSIARNKGIKNSQGELIYFIDDDAVAPAHLLETLWNDFQEQNADVVGGAVHGLWEEFPPTWLISKYWRSLSLLSYGSYARRLDYPEILLGCNMGFRQTVFENYGLFDLNFGHKGAGLQGWEDRELQKRIMDNNGIVYYNPDAYVFHKVPKQRMEIDYFKKRTKGAIESLITQKKNNLEINFTNPVKGILGACYNGFRHGIELCMFEIRLCIVIFKTKIKNND